MVPSRVCEQRWATNRRRSVSRYGLAVDLVRLALWGLRSVDRDRLVHGPEAGVGVNPGSPLLLHEDVSPSKVDRRGESMVPVTVNHQSPAPVEPASRRTDESVPLQRLDDIRVMI